MADYDVADAFKRIENELIDSMMRNLKRHRAEETLEGFDWEQWQVIQLREMERFRLENPKRFGKDFNDINKRVESAIQTAYSDANTAQEARLLEQVRNGKIPSPRKSGNNIKGDFFGINKGRLTHLMDATKADFNRGEVSILRQANDQYRKIIFDAQIYASTAGTYEKAVDMATRDFLKKGIQSIVYKNGSRHSMQEYSRMALKTGQKRAYLMGEGDANDKYGVHTVRVNNRTDACPLCVKWLGRVLIDDVYSGGTLAESQEKDIPLLSQAIDEGFLHPNCKDVLSTYIEGVSKPAKPWSKEEVQEITDKYNAGEELKRSEDMAQSYQRMAKYSLDKENKARYQMRADRWDARAGYWRDRMNGVIPPTPVAPSVAEPKPQVVDTFDRNNIDWSYSGKTLRNRLEKRNVAYNGTKLLDKELTEAEIISKISGADQTRGSCVSVALTYIANKLGIDALDFRGGQSMDIFSLFGWKSVSGIKGINPMIEFKDTIRPSKKLLNSMQEGKQYFFVTGKHASIVRVNNGSFEYLELQSGIENGWTPFEREVKLYEGTPYEQTMRYNVTRTLQNRFGVTSSAQGDAILVDIEEFKNSDEFRDLMGYINTAEAEQKKGAGGGIK